MTLKLGKAIGQYREKLKLKSSSEKPDGSDLVLEPAILTLPPLPAPMHGVNPRTIMGSTAWNKFRKEIYAKAQFRCQACGVHKLDAKDHQWVECHEVYETDFVKGILTFIKAVALCHRCHQYCHPGRLQALLNSGEINHYLYATIIKHGDAILDRAGLERMPDLYDSSKPDWSNWRLVFNKKRYPPKFKSEKAWREHFEEDE